jgi:hypothetical protein
MSVVVQLYEVELAQDEYQKVVNDFLRENSNLGQSELNHKIFDLRRTKTWKKLQEISQKTHEKWHMPQTYETEKLSLMVNAGSIDKAGEVKKWLEDSFGPFKNCALLESSSRQDYKSRDAYSF